MTDTPISADLPVGDDEADALLCDLVQHDCVLLAVSGGPDSLAMLYLVASAWRRADRPVSALRVVTIDHGLRAESFQEAAFVADHAATCGVACDVVRLPDPPGDLAGLQDAMRQRRLAIYAQIARTFPSNATVAVATAHTLDDQLETFWMRLARGSGVDGLAGIPPDRRLDPFDDTRLVRPLLSIPKSRLMATLRARGVTWIEDPSNASPAFERVRVRQAMSGASAVTVAGLEIHHSALARSLGRLRRAEDALARAAHDVARNASLILPGGVFAAMRIAPIRDAPMPVATRVIGALVVAISGRDVPVQRTKLERAVSELQAGQAGEMAVFTVGGCMIRVGSQICVITRELGRFTEGALRCRPPGPHVFDGRFRLSGPGLAQADVTMCPVRENGAVGDAIIAQAAAHWQPLARELAPDPSESTNWWHRAWRESIATLPGIYRDGAFIGAPGLDLATVRAHDLTLDTRKVDLPWLTGA